MKKLIRTSLILAAGIFVAIWYRNKGDIEWAMVVSYGTGVITVDFIESLVGVVLSMRRHQHEHR
jgi:hypothetical protein